MLPTEAERQAELNLHVLDALCVPLDNESLLDLRDELNIGIEYVMPTVCYPLAVPQCVWDSYYLITEIDIVTGYGH